MWCHSGFFGEASLANENQEKLDEAFFAVSLPDFLIFDDDMDAKNKAHCHYLMGLANLGMGEKEEAGKQFYKALKYDFNHQNCRIYLNMVE